jgi:hypothetical protein
VTSVALEEWRGASSQALDEIEFVHASVEGAGNGRQLLTRQVDYAYAALIAAHFQRYCRAVHAEAIRALVTAVPDPSLGSVLKDLLARNRLLDRGNPTSRNLGRDFGRFGFDFWPAVEADDRRNRNRKGKLDQLCAWRNAIVHGDVSGSRGSGRLTPRDLDLTTCRDWRRALGGLADSIDTVVAVGCQDLGCSEPW